jgi:hypothetical protein
MYLLIIGSPRSGTTLLATMIGMHSDVAMLIEDRFFAIKKLTGKKVLANKLCIPIQIEMTKRSNFVKKRLQRFGYLKNYTTSKFNIEDYLKLEGIKIITIIRDCEDVINSIMKRGRKEKKVAEERWSRAIEMIYKLQTKFPEIVVTLSYEDLVNEPESLIKQLADFIKIDFQPQMLEGYKHNMLYPGESGIDSTRAFKAKTTMSNNNFNISAEINDLYNKLLDIKIKP